MADTEIHWIMSDPVSIEQKSFNPFVVPTDVNVQQKSGEIALS